MSERKVHAVGAGARWDDRRNSSLVFQPSINATAEALRALRALRSSDPALCHWIEDGYPTLTEAEHVERFGEPYKSHRKRDDREASLSFPDLLSTERSHGRP